ncbi:MAG: sodium-translocating pyrophosphatase [Patescibacteria group bacterium]|nr:sodium-translocating pyrophosphatase [Patescibacteria group bacterium]MBU4381269.1 sodium-translocating pyrophosphatase [Patescibacteria group bacterium]
MILLYIVLATALLAIVYTVYLAKLVLAKPTGTPEMNEIAGFIREGANTYLKRQFKTIAPLIAVIFVLLLITAPEKDLAFARAFAFLMGSAFSATIGAFGMNIATRANVRVAQASKSSFSESLSIAFKAGATTGMLTVGLGLLGATIIYLLFREKATQVLVGFGFGGSLLAFFMRVGGGIYTKAADVGADLVGKVEKGIPEDDPRNAAVIADLVGDNVGDCAGMAADIFESYEVTLVAAMILGSATFGLPGVIFPLLVRALGIVTSAIGILSVRGDNKTQDGMGAIRKGFLVAAVLSIVGFYFLATGYASEIKFFYATTSGLILAVVVYYITEYFTSAKHKPVLEIAQSTQTGPATTILTGLVVGYESSVYSVLAIAVAIITAVLVFPGDTQAIAYGIALTGMGMLTTTGIIVSMDSFGPIADNAQGIAEMSKMEKGLDILDKLDSVGNTTKAATKGFAIGSAVVAATSLFESFVSDTHLIGIEITKPIVFVGLLLGATIPFLVSSMTIQAVSRAAYAIVNEVRRQFKEIKGIMEGKAKPEYDKIVTICTASAIKELVNPGLIAIAVPVAVVYLLGVEALGGLLVGMIATGQLLAIFMSNAGGAWDNAKKAIEAGLYGGKGSDAHKAAVVGDTVGDPLKDTAGPALNPLIKVINLVALLVAPTVALSHSPIIGIVALGIIIGVLYYQRQSRL